MRIVIVAGEPSGDQLAEGLVKKLRKAYPKAIIEGVAGEKMQLAGCISLYPMDILSVMGVVDVLKSLPQILKVRFGLLRYFKKNPPDLYIGIDAPDFNLPIEKKLKKRGVKTIHYVSPSVWAWRESRMKTIKKATDVVLAILPFEEEYYDAHGHKAVFVGHPLASKIPYEPLKNARKLYYNIKPSTCVVGLLPGSRFQEVDRLVGYFLGAALKLQEKIEGVKFLLPIARVQLKECLIKYKTFMDKLNIDIIDGDSHRVIEASDIVVVASGTATLETMLYKKPMVMVYKLGAINYLLAKLFIKIKRFSLPNILANKDLIVELIQDAVTADNIVDEVLNLYSNTHYRNKMVENFYGLHEKLLCDSDEKAYRVVESLLNK